MQRCIAHHIGHLTPLTLLACRPPWIPPSRLWPQRCSPWRWSTHAGTCQQSSGGALSSSACSALRRPCWIPPVATRWVTAEGTGHAFVSKISFIFQRCHSQSWDKLYQPNDGTTSMFINLCTSAQTFTLTHLPLCSVPSYLMVSVPITRDHGGSFDVLLWYSRSKRLIKGTATLPSEGPEGRYLW